VIGGAVEAGETDPGAAQRQRLAGHARGVGYRGAHLRDGLFQPHHRVVRAAGRPPAALTPRRVDDHGERLAGAAIDAGKQ